MDESADRAEGVGRGRGERVNQKLRTRRALMEAAAQLVQRGQVPSLADVAAEANVSRATVYRYFPSAEALVEESFFELEFPDPVELLGDGPPDPVERVRLVEQAVNDLLFDHEVQTRVVVRNIIDAGLSGTIADSAARPGRRLVLLDAALEPLAERLGPTALRRLRDALALTIGTEAVLATRDVSGLSTSQARQVTAWASLALVRQAIAESDSLAAPDS